MSIYGIALRGLGKALIKASKLKKKDIPVKRLKQGAALTTAYVFGKKVQKSQSKNKKG